jgi:hypothetical protein
MLIIERRNSNPRWYYIFLAIFYFRALVPAGSFGALLTAHVRWKPKAKKLP